MSIGFVNELYLFALPAMLLPVLVHLFFQRRTRRQPFPAMEFLFARASALRLRTRLERYTLLAARVLLVALVILLFARPYLEERHVSDIPADSAADVVIIVDTSLSMSYRLDGVSRLDEAKDTATSIIESAPELTGFVVITTAPEAKPLMSAMVHDKAAVLDAVDDITQTSAMGDGVAALEVAGSILSQSDRGVKRVYFVSDFTKASLQGVAPGSFKALASYYRPMPVGPPAPPSNLSIVEVEANAKGDVGEERIELVVKVRNQGPTTKVPKVIIEWDDDSIISSVTVPPGVVAPVSFSVATADKSTVTGTARLEPDDSLVGDDVASWIYESELTLDVLVINGQPRNVPLDDEVYFLGTAYDATATIASPVSAQVVRPEEVSSSTLGSFDVVILANVLTLQKEVVVALTEFVEEGGGLIITAGDNVTEATNELFGALLPYSIRSLKTELSPFLATGQSGGAHVGVVEETHPVFAAFDGDALGSLTAATVSRYLLVEPQVGHGGKPLVTLTNGAPLLVERQVGKGIVLMLTTTIDDDWNDIPLHPAFVPLVHGMVIHAARAGEELPAQSVPVGAPLVIPVGGGVAEIEVTDPAGEVTTMEVVEAPSVTYTKTLLPGLYTIGSLSGESGAPLGTLEHAIVHVDPAETDLSPAPPAPLDATPAEPTQVVGSVQTPLTLHVGLLMLLLLAIEALLLLRRTPGRETAC